MAKWYLARVELHEYLDGGETPKKPVEKTYEDVHKQMLRLGFSRITVLVKEPKKFRLPDATYEKREAEGDTPDSVRESIADLIAKVWPADSFGVVLVKYAHENFKQVGLRPAPQSLINFENQFGVR